MSVEAETSSSGCSSSNPILHTDKLNIANSIERFHAARTDPDADDTDDLTALSDPQAASTVLQSQIAFLRKLKFQYLEQNAKDKYIKYILTDLDDAPLISAEDNEALTQANDRRKATLREEKAAFAERCNEARELSELVDQEMIKAKAKLTQLSTLDTTTLDARLNLTRLRTSHPAPRLTTALAQTQLDEQITSMQTMSDEKDALQTRIAAAKEKLRVASLKNESLRAEKHLREEEDARVGAGGKDERVVPLYDWYTEHIALHKALTGLTAHSVVSENELSLTYRVPSSSNRSTTRDVRISLIFKPDRPAPEAPSQPAQLLADVQVDADGIEEDDLGDVLVTYVKANDAPGLIAAVVSRVAAL